MTPDQIQQLINGQLPKANFGGIISALPWWLTAIYLILIAGALACAVCLPLIAWLLAKNNNFPRPKSGSVPRHPAIAVQQTQREPTHKTAFDSPRTIEQREPNEPSDFSASAEVGQAPADDDSRFRPKS
jgi:hypothetical protein